MVNLASSEAIVMVTMENAEEEATTPSGTVPVITGGAGPSGSGVSIAGPSGLTATTGNNMASAEPMVVVHRGNDDSLGDYGVLDLASDLALGLDVGSLSETLKGAEGGVKVRLSGEAELFTRWSVADFDNFDLNLLRGLVILI